MTADLVRRLREASLTFKASTWTQPNDVGLHRERVAKAVSTNATDYAYRFEYPEIDFKGYAKALRPLTTLAGEIGVESLREPVLLHIESCVNRASALSSDNDDEYRSVAVSLDALPTKELVDYALSLLTGQASNPAAPEETMAAQELVHRFEAALDSYDLKGWHVQISSSMSAKMSVNGPLRRVRIRADATFGPMEVDRLLIHEIGGHVLRWENAARQPEPLSLLPLGPTVATEEGLALWAEQEAGLLDPTILRIYAARVLAVDLAQTQGILQVASTLNEYIDLTLAVEIAIRVKRGLLNPNNPGGLTKDWGYLGGLQKMNDLAKADPTGLHLLRGVKWSIQHLPLAKKLQSEGHIRMAELSSDPTRLGIVGTPIPRGEAAEECFDMAYLANSTIRKAEGN